MNKNFFRVLLLGTLGLVIGFVLLLESSMQGTLAEVTEAVEANPTAIPEVEVEEAPQENSNSEVKPEQDSNIPELPDGSFDLQQTYIMTLSDTSQVCQYEGSFYYVEGDVWDLLDQFGNEWNRINVDYLVDRYLQSGLGWWASGRLPNWLFIDVVYNDGVLYLPNIEIANVVSCKDTPETIEAIFEIIEVTSMPWVSMDAQYGGDWRTAPLATLRQKTFLDGTVLAKGLSQDGRVIYALIQAGFVMPLEFIELPPADPPVFFGPEVNV
ncbi:MAG: hypothetical protein ACOZAO_05950 [Patescibacteria group bacterium]